MTPDKGSIDRLIRHLEDSDNCLDWYKELGKKADAALPALLAMQSFMAAPQERIREALGKVQTAIEGQYLHNEIDVERYERIGLTNEHLDVLAALLAAELFTAPELKEGEPE